MPSAEAHTYSSFTPARVRSQGSELGTRDITCFQCRKTGHIAKVCPEKKIIKALQTNTTMQKRTKKKHTHMTSHLLAVTITKIHQIPRGLH